MQRKTGTYIIQRVNHEPFKAFIPSKLPPTPPLALEPLYPKLEKATQAVAELNAMGKNVPNTSLFIYMYVRKEALLSSQIEGTQSSFSDLILFEHKQKTGVSKEDVEEVSYYVKALQHGLKRLRKDNFPLSLRLLREIHEILLSGGRGATKLPGEFRKSQNWIGGTRSGNAVFVPPPPEKLMECLSDFEHFLYDETLPVLIKAGLAHVQFETIHPFLDGNGRLGRLLITLLLCENHLLAEPILYLSLYLKQNRAQYYQLLDDVRLYGAWEAWLEFFLEGIYKSAIQAIRSTEKINKLLTADLTKIETLGRARFSCVKVFEYLKQSPQTNVAALAKALKISAPTVRSALNKLCDLKIMNEISGLERDKVYVYSQYLKILEEGTEPIL